MNREVKKKKNPKTETADRFASCNRLRGIAQYTVCGLWQKQEDAR